MTWDRPSDFISTTAHGKNWRDIAKAALEDLSDAASTGHYTVGFVYINDQLAEDAESILTLFRSVLGIENWVGSLGIGICSDAGSFVDEPALCAMIAHIDPDHMTFFDDHDLTPLAHWCDDNDPMLGIVHGNPFAEENPEKLLKDLGAQSHEAFWVGGMTSSHGQHIQFSGTQSFNEQGLNGVLFSRKVPCATVLSQGSIPFSEILTITSADGFTIRTINDRPAAEVFHESLKSLGDDAYDAFPHHPEEIDGDICAGFMIQGVDQREYQVRNILKATSDGGLMVARNVESGERLMFVHRNDRSVKVGLCKQIMDLRARVIREQGHFAPKAAFYFSCIARAYGHNNTPQQQEISLIKEIIGDVPLVGFYANGEIHHGRLYGFTGVLALLL